MKLIKYDWILRPQRIIICILYYSILVIWHMYGMTVKLLLNSNLWRMGLHHIIPVLTGGVAWPGRCANTKDALIATISSFIVMVNVIYYIWTKARTRMTTTTSTTAKTTATTKTSTRRTTTATSTWWKWICSFHLLLSVDCFQLFLILFSFFYRF